jgi:hypothetical protein
MMEASRQRAAKRKLKIMSHKWVSTKVMPLSFLFLTSLFFVCLFITVMDYSKWPRLLCIYK